MTDGSRRSLPVPTPETEHFWQGTRDGKLLLQRCNDCKTVYFPPRPFCPECSSRSIRVEPSSGRGVLYSYVINHRAHPAFDGPYAIAVVQLDEGPRLMTNIVNCAQTPEALQLDMAVQVHFETVSQDITLPLFAPVGDAKGELS